MRINCGKYKSKLVSAIPGNNTRPTSDKIRESIFDVLNNHGLVKGDVLDLFAGSGALGIDAVSRGCSSCVFVDKNPLAARLIRKNISFVEEHTEVYNTDWKVAVKKLKGRNFDIIFLDPPYALGIEQNIVAEIENNRILKPGGVIIIEHDKRNVLNFDNKSYSVFEKNYSSTTVTYLIKVASKCVFPGSFDPITLGHIEIIKKALRDFDSVLIAVAKVNYKESVDASVRLNIVNKAIENDNNVTACIFDGNLTDFLDSLNCFNIVRGYRNDEDFEYEMKLKNIYLSMDSRVNFILYGTDIDISSSNVRTSKKDRLHEMLPACILDDVCDIYGID